MLAKRAVALFKPNSQITETGQQINWNGRKMTLPENDNS